MNKKWRFSLSLLANRSNYSLSVSGIMGTDPGTGPLGTPACLHHRWAALFPGETIIYLLTHLSELFIFVSFREILPPCSTCLHQTSQICLPVTSLRRAFSVITTSTSSLCQCFVLPHFNDLHCIHHPLSLQEISTAWISSICWNFPRAGSTGTCHALLCEQSPGG